MNKEDIIRMARETRLVPKWLELCKKDEEALGRFFHAAHAAGAAAERERIKAANAPVIQRINEHIKTTEEAAAAEREACAKMVDHILKEGGGTYGDAIRRRGEVKP